MRRANVISLHLWIRNTDCINLDKVAIKTRLLTTREKRIKSNNCSVKHNEPYREKYLSTFPITSSGSHGWENFAAIVPRMNHSRIDKAISIGDVVVVDIKLIVKRLQI